MSEFIRAFPVSGRVPRHIEVRERINMGENTGLVFKELISGKIGNKNISLLSRGEYPLYVTNWLAFKNAGLPVVPTLRIDAKQNVLVTDVKANGSEVYGKGMDYQLTYSMGERFRPNPECDNTFLSITEPSPFALIEDAVADLVVKANNSYIKLPYDDPCELVVNPNGTWELMILDLRFGRPYDPKDITNYEMMHMRMENRNQTWYFLQHLQNIRKLLMPKRKIEKKSWRLLRR